jgi:hypothetical protein
VRILDKVLVVCAISLAGCASDRDAATNRFISQGNLALQGKENRDEISYWHGTGSEGEPRIVIDLDQQRAYFYKGDQIAGVSVVSTGREGYDTPAGEFRIIEKDREHVFDRSSPLPTGGHLEQADGTAWVSMFSQNMFEIAMELASHDKFYEDMAVKFADHFIWIAHAMDAQQFLDAGKAGAFAKGESKT